MRLAIVGSVSLGSSPMARRIIEGALDELQPDVVVSGGAVGIDSLAATIAREQELQVVEYLPATPNWAGYKPRNLLIARGCDALIRIASTTSHTYGSGWTRDRAVELGKPCTEFLIDPVTDSVVFTKQS